jgi:hypothetical protein
VTDGAVRICEVEFSTWSPSLPGRSRDAGENGNLNSSLLAEAQTDLATLVHFRHLHRRAGSALLPPDITPAPPGSTDSPSQVDRGGSRLGRLVDAYDRRRGGRSVVLGWLVTRLLILLILAAAERFVVGDVFYYWRKLNALSDVGLAQTLNEYPTPVTWILWLPYGVTGGSRVGYLVAFIVFMMALDAAFTWMLWRQERRHDAAIDFWLVFVLLIGPLSYLRFDVLPAVLAGGALLAARRSRPSWRAVRAGRDPPGASSASGSVWPWSAC